MSARLLLIAVLLPLLFSSCAVLQWPARATSYVLAPLAENEQPAATGEDLMNPAAMIALKYNEPDGD